MPPIALLPPITFPQDEGVHPGTKTEWWYMNGHLSDDKGRLIDFFGALSNIPSILNAKFNPDHWNPPVDLPQLFGTTGWEGALTVRSPTNDPRHFPIRELRPYMLPWNVIDQHGLTEGRMDSQFDTWEGPVARFIRTGATTMSLTAPYGTGNALSLECSSAKKPGPLLEGGQGWVHMGPLGNSRYYSFPGMDAKGSLTLEGAVTAVKGTVWFDHQWGDMAFFDPYKRWRWFGIQLDGNIQIVTFIFYGDNNQILQTNASMLKADGSQLNLQAMEGEQAVLLVTDEGDPWTSPSTGARYPLTPRLQIPAFNADFRLKPVMFDQEMVGKGPKDIMTGGHLFPDYWEGSVSVEGTLDGKPIKGQAYQELLGYNADTPGVTPLTRDLPKQLAADLTKWFFDAKKDARGKPVL